jgi:uncharacterized NAD(P)/FAD-binding protein YdhS
MKKPEAFTSRIGIIGGGASGAVLAACLLRRVGADTEIVLIEKSKEIGRGLAFSTWDPNHLLNVRAGNMSAYADQPDHFYEWLQIHGPRHGIGCPTRFCFVPRGVYGEYLSGLLQDVPNSQQLRIMQDECVNVSSASDGITLQFASGSNLTVDHCVLATGNEQRPPLLTERGENPWAAGVLDRIENDATLLAIGTGLTMVDAVLSLYRRGHRGKIIAVSRRGLLPHTHQMVKARKLDPGDVPFGAPISYLTRWVREMARTAMEEGQDWRSTIDSLRPHTQELWKRMTLDQRSRFLRHARPWWNVVRHRMAPQIADLIENLIAEGRLRVVAAHIVDAKREGNKITASLFLRGEHKTETITVASILECTGLPDDPRYSANPAIVSLFAAGQIRSGPLGIGLDLDDRCSVIDTEGLVSARLFAVGPLTRGVFWESIALPDIRNQCANLAALLAERLNTSRQELPLAQ